MQLLIDGYNLLKKIKHSVYISDSERQNFIKKLNHYAHQKKLSIILVFDGGPHNWSMHEKISSMLEVIYSGAQESADDYIKQYLEMHKNRDLLLITSDRELVAHARKYGIASIGSYEFSEFMAEQRAPTQLNIVQDNKIHKMVVTKHKELDLLMEQLTVPKQKNEIESDGIKERYKKNKLSKNERTVLKKIKKL